MPPSIGTFRDKLRSIILHLTINQQAVRVFIPGRIAAVCIAMDEDSAPRDVMERAFNDVKALMQNRLNDFFNSLNIDALTAEAMPTTIPVGNEAFAIAWRDSVLALFTQKLATFMGGLGNEAASVAEQSAVISVMTDSDWWNPIDILKSAVAGLDPDKLIGSAGFIISERDAIGNNLHESLHADLRQPSTTLGGAWYIIDGFTDGKVRFRPEDLKIESPPVTTRPIGSTSEHVIKHGRQCLEEGKTIRFNRLSHAETSLVWVTYPFFQYRYFLDGIELTGPNGTVQIQKTVSIPEFDEDEFYFVAASQESKLVKIKYKKQRQANDLQIGDFCS